MVADNFLVTASDGASQKITINITIKLSAAKTQRTIPNIFIFHSLFKYDFISLNAKGADLRHTSHGSPQTTFKYGKSAPVWVAVPIKKVCSYSYGGDCVTIEQYILHSLRNASAKLVKKVEKAGLFCAKDIKKATISYNSGQKRGVGLRIIC